MSIFTTGDSISSGTVTGIQLAQQLINSTWANGKTTTNALDSLVTSAASTLDSEKSLNALTVDVASTTDITEPSVTIPSTIDASSVMATFDTKQAEMVTLLTSKFSTFQSTYFPNDGTSFSAVQGWIDGAISNTDHGIPAAVASQLMTDAKSRAYADLNLQSDTMFAAFSSRRFPLPPGAAASALQQITEKAQDAISTSSRELMMKYLDQIKFAVEKSLSMREEAMKSAIAYITALAAGPNLASGLVGIGYDAQSKLVSSAASFYNARTEAARMVRQAEQFNIDRKFAKDAKNVENDMTLSQEKIKLMLLEVQALAQISTGLFNNLHTSASVAG